MAQAMQIFRDNSLRAKALEGETASIRDQSEIERRRREAVAQQEAAELSSEVAFFQVSGGRATARKRTAAPPARPATRPATPVEQRASRSPADAISRSARTAMAGKSSRLLRQRLSSDCADWGIS